MQGYELMQESILSHLQEFSEDCVDNFRVDNYYDLVDLLFDLWNIRAKLYKKDNDLYNEIVKELN